MVNFFPHLDPKAEPLPLWHGDLGFVHSSPVDVALLLEDVPWSKFFSDLFGWDDGYIMVYLVGGVEHLDYFSIFGGGGWECHNPNWRTHIFQRGRYTTSQI